MRSAADRAYEAVTLTGWTDSETAHVGAVKAITDARLDVVKRLREMADHDECHSDDTYGVTLLRVTADQLEAEIRAAGEVTS